MLAIPNVDVSVHDCDISLTIYAGYGQPMRVRHLTVSEALALAERLSAAVREVLDDAEMLTRPGDDEEDT